MPVCVMCVYVWFEYWLVSSVCVAMEQDSPQQGETDVCKGTNSPGALLIIY